MHSSFTSETTINYGKYSDTGYKGGLEGVKNFCLKWDVSRLIFKLRMKLLKKMASVAPNGDPEVKGQPIGFYGDTTRIVFSCH